MPAPWIAAGATHTSWFLTMLDLLAEDAKDAIVSPVVAPESPHGQLDEKRGLKRTYSNMVDCDTASRMRM